ncbi:MAG: alpha/beta hydrolase [Candidatus Cloacimonetes bacterium]|nr:alpha/beta hydrolase [Candidatus Cloacimonadota bacterium]
MLIAGLGSDSQSWQPIIKDLSQNFLVITFDNRGVGRTKPMDIDLSIQQIADDCISLVKHLGFSSINLLGHSMGGFVALDCAIRHPKNISKLILAGTSAYSSERNNALLLDWVSYQKSGMDLKLWFRNMFYWLFTKQFFKNDKTVTEAINFALEYPYPQSDIAFANQVKTITKYNCLKYLPVITSKTMIICGKEDLLFPAKESIKLLKKIPEAKFSIIENAAHSIFMENPKAFIECVLEFINDRKYQE